MSSTVKHWVDVTVAVVTILGSVAAPVITFVTSVLGAIWYGIRIYDRLKGKGNVNIRHD